MARVRTTAAAESLPVEVLQADLMDMFDPGNYCLFGREESCERLACWKVVAWRPERFSAPRETVKEFTTLIADKPD